MKSATKDKAPSEFDRFRALTKKLVSVPKEELKKREEKQRAKKTKL